MEGGGDRRACDGWRDGADRGIALSICLWSTTRFSKKLHIPARGPCYPEKEGGP